MTGRTVTALLSALLLSAATQLGGCGAGTKQGDTSMFKSRLSEYGLFQGNLSGLVPVNEAAEIEIASPLFTDYADKQRLLLLPTGEMMKANGSDLPDFPDGTVIAKTFFYPRSGAGDSVSQQIIETRLLIKNGAHWNAATYKWNDTQDEAYLLHDSATVPIEFVDDHGHSRAINYSIPSQEDCFACHRQRDELVPLGMKLRNMNIDVHRDQGLINQLEYLQQNQKLEISPLDAVGRTPDYRNQSITLDERARAYLDANCAHCHRPKGTARFTGLVLTYEETADRAETHLKAQEIARRITTSGPQHMPQIGTTIPHAEGIDLIIDYLNDISGKTED